jgi:hypothetical protein
MSSDDVNHFAGNKCEVTDVKEEEDPWLATSVEIKIEPTVSCMSVYHGLCT